MLSREKDLLERLLAKRDFETIIGLRSCCDHKINYVIEFTAILDKITIELKITKKIVTAPH